MKPQKNYPHIITDDTFRETAAHGSESFPFCYYLEDIWDFDFHCIDWHWHHELEFIYVKSGTAVCYVGDEKFLLPQGSALFVNSGILHRYESAASTLMPNIVFSPSLLAADTTLLYEQYIAPILSSSLCFQAFSPDVPWQGKILGLLNKLFSIQDSEEKGNCTQSRPYGRFGRFYLILFLPLSKRILFMPVKTIRCVSAS